MTSTACNDVTVLRSGMSDEQTGICALFSVLSDCVLYSESALASTGTAV